MITTEFEDFYLSIHPKNVGMDLHHPTKLYGRDIFIIDTEYHIPYEVLNEVFHEKENMINKNSE